jgi:hypothetical protein
MLWQSSDPKMHSTEVKFQRWDGEKWEIMFIARGLGGGSWNMRPREPGSSWRLVNLASTGGHWRVNEVNFFSDTSCVKPSPGRVIDGREAFLHSGSELGEVAWKYTVDYAFDGRLDTAWSSHCSPCRYSHEAWIGQEGDYDVLDALDWQAVIDGLPDPCVRWNPNITFENGTEFCHNSTNWSTPSPTPNLTALEPKPFAYLAKILDPADLPRRMRCFKIHQSQEKSEAMEEIRIEVWSGDQWEHVDVDAEGLGAGNWDMRPKPFARSSWRLARRTAVGHDTSLFSRFVLGWIETKFCNQIRMFSGFSRSTKLST